MATMRHHRTCRSRRRFSPVDAQESPVLRSSNRSCNLRKSLVFWSLCFAIFYGAPPLVEASSASAPQAPGSAAWQGAFAAHDNSTFPGGSASSDEGDDLVESEPEKEEEPTPSQLVGEATQRQTNDAAASSEQADLSAAPDTENNINKFSVNVERTEQQSSEDDKDESVSILATETAAFEDESELESEEETDSESQDVNNVSMENSQMHSTRRQEVEESSLRSIQEQEDDKDESVSILATETAAFENESELESEEETDSESQEVNNVSMEVNNETMENSQIPATLQLEMVEPSLQSIQELEEAKQESMEEQEALVSDAEVEWFDSDDAVVEVSMDVLAISKGDVNLVESQEAGEEFNDEEDEEASPQPSLAAQVVKPAFEDVGETADDLSNKEDDESRTPIQTGLVDECETESDEEGSVSTNEIESDDEQYDWSEDEKSDDESTVYNPGPTVSSARPVTPKISEQSDPTASTTTTPIRTQPKDYRSTVSAAKANVSPNHRQKRRRTYRSSRHFGSPHDLGSSQPLKTLEKLQHMLDETDYMTAAPGVRSDGMRRELSAPNQETVMFDQAIAPNNSVQTQNPRAVPPPDHNMNKEASGHQDDKLWTSKDRMKYKKQQAKVRRAKEEQRRLQEQFRSPPLHPNSSDDENTDDTDDGLGFSLPLNLPVYFSDAEGTTDLTDVDHSQPLHQSGHTHHPFQPPPPPPFAQRGPYPYPPPPGFYPPNVPPMQPGQNLGQPVPHYYPPNPYAPYGSYGPYNQQQIASQYAAGWAAAASSGGVPPFGTPQYSRPYYPQASSAGMIEPPKPDKNQPVQGKVDDTKKEPASEPKPDERSESVSSAVKIVEQQFPVAPDFQMTNVPYQLAPAANMGAPSSLAEASSNLGFDSIQKLSVFGIVIALLCYSAVSPRTLPAIEYNEKFYENLKIVSLMMIAPLLTFLMVFDPKENDINKAVNAFYMAFTLGYGVTFLLQIVLTTVIRLGIFSWFEPDIFQLTPEVPTLVLPWVLRENRYRPKRITLFAADFATSCVASPIIEEYIKLKIVQWSVRLPRNFKWTKKASSKNKKKKRLKAEAIPRYPGDPEVTNLNPYVTQMLAVSIGIKFADSARRILMYTKATDENKGFYALCRGIFPIQELCGTMTALALAKRDVLGWNMPLWKMLAPAVVIHGMANFRGMKPIFKWNAATPWSEMQLLPWNAADDSTLAQLANKGFAKLMWVIILGRVLGYCIKNYYLIRRQAVKRTTTYFGKRAAFSAELAAAEMLKKTAKDK